MVYEEIVLQLFLISLGIVIFSMLLNKLMGINPQAMKEIRNKALNLQKRFSMAQALNDGRMVQELQIEMKQLMGQMAKKQLAPLCIRCIIFLGILTILTFIYGEYEFWFWLYFLFSLSISLTILFIRLGYKKLTGKDDKKKQNFAKEILGMFGSSSSGLGQGNLIQAPRETPQMRPYGPSASQTTSDWKDRIHDTKPIEKKDTWKDRIQE